MPYLPKEVIHEIELEIADLVDENAELRKRADEAERQLREFKTRYPEVP